MRARASQGHHKEGAPNGAFSSAIVGWHLPGAARLGQSPHILSHPRRAGDPPYTPVRADGACCRHIPAGEGTAPPALSRMAGYRFPSGQTSVPARCRL